MLNFIIAFFCLMLLDFVWVFYTRAMIEHRAFRSGYTAALVQLFGGSATLAIVADPFAIGGMMLGAFVGTILAMRITR